MPVLLPIAAFLVTLIVFLPFASLGLDLHHDSLMLKTAMDLASGQALYRDTFTQYGTFAALLHTWAYQLGGSLIALKALTVGAYAVAAAFFVATWERVLPRKLVVLSFLFWLLFAPFYDPRFVMLPWASVIALACQAASLYWLLRGFSSSSAVAFLASGVCAGLALWSRMPVGGLLIAALGGSCLFLPRGQRLRALGAGAAGVALVCGGFVAWLVAQGTLAPWYEQTLVWPRQWAAHMGSSWRHILHSLLFAGVDDGLEKWAAALRWIMVLGFCAMVWRLVSRRGRRDRIEWVVGALAVLALIDWRGVASIRPWVLLIPMTTVVFFIRGLRKRPEPWAMAFAAVSIASWAQYFPVTCPRHIFWSLGPAFGFFVYVLTAQGLSERRVLSVLGLLLLPLAVARLGVATGNLLMARESLGEIPVLRGISVAPEMASALKGFAATIRDDQKTHPARPMVVDGPDALPAVLVSDLRNFHPFYVEWAPYRRPEAEYKQREVFVREHKPWIAVQPPRAGAIEGWRRDFGYEVARDIGGDFGVLLKPAGG